MYIPPPRSSTMPPYTALAHGKHQPLWASARRLAFSNTIFSGKIDVHPVLVKDTMYKLPFSLIPQVAFVGRSNVGKSSLINSLVHGREITRPSPLPGRTRQLFTFDIGETVSLVDLPGYGFAGKVSHADQKEWTEMIKLYVEKANGLERVVSLIDCRQGIKKIDEDFWKLLTDSPIHPKRSAGALVMVVLTKVDLLSENELGKVINSVIPLLEHHKRASGLRLWPYLHAVSAETGFGMNELRSAIAFMCPQPDENRNSTSDSVTFR